jgi:membrane protein DedA with SNARE-associated domain
MRRICGWALVLGGLGYTLAYALAPIAIASTLAMCLLAPAVVVVASIVARCAWMRIARSGD